MKVLFIAGASPTRERLAEVISELSGVQVEICEPDGLKDRKIMEVHPDVILIDMDQSRGRGLETIRQFRKLPRERVPVIMAIGSIASLQYRASCAEAGAMYFFDRVREQDWLIDSLASIREQLT